jgi:hypothetical protein
MSESIETMIYFVRGYKVMLDRDLAIIYGVDTKAINRSVDRNLERFPEDFSFQLSLKEWENLKYQFGTSSSWGGRRKLPRVFTEHGAYAAAFVLRSNQAKKMSVEVVRAFVQMRRILFSQKKLDHEFTELKSFLLKRFHETDKEFKRVWQAIEKLSISSNDEGRIGFCLE